MKIQLGAAATAVALTVLAGCGDDGGATASDPAERTTPATTTSEPTTAPTVGTYPAFGAEDYVYVLEQICFCPITGPVEVSVEDGEVISAVILKGGGGIKKGSEAPEYLRLTIDDVIAEANDTEAAEVQVTWPEGQEWPDRVSVDQVEMATDDEITFIVRNVRVAD